MSVHDLKKSLNFLTLASNFSRLQMIEMSRQKGPFQKYQRASEGVHSTLSVSCGSRSVRGRWGGKAVRTAFLTLSLIKHMVKWQFTFLCLFPNPPMLNLDVYFCFVWSNSLTISYIPSKLRPFLKCSWRSQSCPSLADPDQYQFQISKPKIAHSPLSWSFVVMPIIQIWWTPNAWNMMSCWTLPCHPAPCGIVDIDFNQFNFCLFLSVC